MRIIHPSKKEAVAKTKNIFIFEKPYIFSSNKSLLFLILSITFAPVGQSIAMDIVDMGTMTEACLDCTHNMDENDNTCVNSECFQEACLGSFTVPALSIIDT